MNTAAGAVFDNDVKIKDKRLFVRDLEARALLKATLDELINPANLKTLIAEPIIVQRRDKLPVILRLWPFEGAAAEQEVYALIVIRGGSVCLNSFSGLISGISAVVIKMMDPRSGTA